MTRGNAIQTASGRLYYPAAPAAADVDVCDIAASLSKLCRFGGHSKRFYSVAEHAVLVSYCVPPEHALTALHHDDTEAYCADVPRPLKRMLANYAEIEERNWRAIAEHFNLPMDLPECVKHADNAVLMAEKAVLMVNSCGVWPDIEPADVPVIGLSPIEAEYVYLKRHAELKAASPARS